MGLFAWAYSFPTKMYSSHDATISGVFLAAGPVVALVTALLPGLIGDAASCWETR